MIASMFSCVPCCADKSGAETVVVVAHPSDVVEEPRIPLTSVSKMRGHVPEDCDKVGTDAPSSIASSMPPVVPAAARGTDAPSLVVSPEFVEFNVTVDKSGGQKLGLEISAHDGRTLLVGKVKNIESPVSRWNAQQSIAQLRIYRGDRLVAINDASGNSDSILEAQSADVLTMKVRRLLEFTVSIDLLEGGESLGLDFEDVGSGVVAVSHMQSQVNGLPSLAHQKNVLNSADLEIRVDDVVVQVNGADATDAESIRRVASKLGALEFRLRRPAPAALELILTVHVSLGGSGELAAVSCTTMSGEEVCSVRVSLDEPVRSLRAAISSEMPGQTFQMLLPSGQILQPKDDSLLLTVAVAVAGAQGL